jgi:hypothetical protein
MQGGGGHTRKVSCSTHIREPLLSSRERLASDLQQNRQPFMGTHAAIKSYSGSALSASRIVWKYR